MTDKENKIGFCSIIKPPTVEEPFFKILGDWKVERCFYEHDGKFITHEDMIKMLEEYASQFKPLWIPVNCGLPNSYEKVLVFTSNGGRHLCYNTAGDNRWREYANDNLLYYNVTHWMSLRFPNPKPTP